MNGFKIEGSKYVLIGGRLFLKLVISQGLIGFLWLQTVGALMTE